MNAPLRGLVLAGGHSQRMQRDKATLQWHGRSQLDAAVDLLRPFVTDVSVSVRADQRSEPTRARHAQIVDLEAGLGPIAGLLAAQAQDPDAAWLLLACDLPRLDATTLQALLDGRDPARLATAFRSENDGLPEPLCAIYEPASAATVTAFVAGGRICPRKYLLTHDVRLLDLPVAGALDNVNTPDELARVTAAAAGAGAN